MYPSITPNDLFPAWFEKHFKTVKDEKRIAQETVRFNTLKLIQAFLKETDDEINEVGRQVLQHLLKKGEVEVNEQDVSLNTLHSFIANYEDVIEDTSKKLKAQAIEFANTEKEIAAKDQLLDPLLKADLSSDEEILAKELSTEITALQATLGNVKKNISDLKSQKGEALIAFEIVKGCLKSYSLPTEKGQLGKMQRDLLHLMLRRYTPCPDIVSLAASNTFFNKQCKPLLGPLKDEYTQRKLESFVKYLPKNSIRHRKPKHANALIEEKIALAKSWILANPKHNFLYKTGDLAQFGVPPLYLAATRANQAMWKMLLSYLPEENREIDSKIAQLQWAVTNVELHNVRDIVSSNPDLLITKSPLTRWDCTPFFIAARQHNRNTHEILMHHIPDTVSKSVRDATECLYFVIGGQQAHAESIVQVKPALILTQGIDGYSPLQIAASLGDMYMLRMLVSHLKPEEYETASVQLNEVDKHVWRFDPAAILVAYEYFFDNFDRWYKTGNPGTYAAWQAIGWELRLAPQHVVAEFCQAHQLDPTSDFKHPELKRECKLYDPLSIGSRGVRENLFPFQVNSGLGFEFHINRQGGGWHREWAAPSDGGRSDSILDFRALEALLAVRNAEYLEIKQMLKFSPEQSLSLVCGGGG